MRRNTLHERSITLPATRGHFHRPRLDKLLDGFLSRYLVVVIAGAGWGKTHALSMFLTKAQARVIWFQLSELDNHISRFWRQFVHFAALQNEEIAASLERLGFPETLAKFDQFLHILAKDIYASEQMVFVLDDFHLIYDKSIINFVEQLVLAKLENFCVIISARSKPSFSLTGLLAGDLAGEITVEDLHFTSDETESYLRRSGISLPARELKKVQSFTEGWPLALYLVGLSIKKGGMVANDPIAGAVPLIFEMIEREMFCDCAPEVKTFLIKASLLNSFPKGLVRILAGDSIGSVGEFMDTNMFTYYNAYTGHYHFHLLFLEFLKGKQELLPADIIPGVYLEAANWCAAAGLKIDALGYYGKCGRYGEILDIMLNYGMATFPRTTADFFIGLLDSFPPELARENPMTHVLRAGLLLNNAEIEPAIAELTETRLTMESLPRSADTDAALGNTYSMLGLLSLGSCDYNFVELFKLASEYLPSGGLLDSRGKAINTKYSIMLGSPAPGELDKMERALFEAMPYASRAMNGYGHGLEYLASAEAAFFTGDMKKAVKNAYEAVYRARDKRVSDVASSGYFLLMRIGAANGDYKSIVSNMTQLRSYAEEADDKLNFNGMPDVAEGWFHLTFGRHESVASWIMDDPDGVLAPYSMGMERMIKAKCLLQSGRYYELLAWLGQSEELYRRGNMWLMLLDNLIYKAVASNHIRDEAQTLAALSEACEIARGNNLVMQFVELGNDMRSLAYAAKRGSGALPELWLDELYAKSATYEKRINSLKSQYHEAFGSPAKPSVRFTKNELEMLRYLCQGLTNTEIASARYISLSAVKKSLNNIYIKLGATNRADAVRIAIQMGLNA